MNQNEPKGPIYRLKKVPNFAPHKKRAGILAAMSELIANFVADKYHECSDILI